MQIHVLVWTGLTFGRTKFEHWFCHLELGCLDWYQVSLGWPITWNTLYLSHESAGNQREKTSKDKMPRKRNCTILGHREVLLEFSWFGSLFHWAVLTLLPICLNAFSTVGFLSKMIPRWMCLHVSSSVFCQWLGTCLNKLFHNTAYNI